MKTFLYTLCFLLLVGCNAIKQKEKTTSSTHAETTERLNAQVQNSTQSFYSLSAKDSATTKLASVKTSQFLTSLQTLSLRNNGKCEDPGQTTYLTYRDGTGNEYSVPVNNNTELSFGSDKQSSVKVDSLVQENNALTLRLEDAAVKNDSLMAVSKELWNNLETTNESLSKYSKRPTIGAMLFWCLLSIVVYKIIEVQIKKLL